MKKVMTILIVLTIVAILPQAVLAQGPDEVEREMSEADPESVLRGLFDALNRRDVEGALAFVADHAVGVLTPPPPGSSGLIVGKEEFRERYKAFVAANEQSKFIDLKVTGSTATMRSLIWADEFRAVGVSPVEVEGTAFVKDGLLQSYTFMLTDQSMNRLMAGIAREANKALIQRYMEAWDQGDLEALDEIFAEDFVNHSPPLPADREGMMQAAADEHIGFPNNVWTIEQIVAEGDMVAVHVHFVGIHEGEFFGVPATGAEVDFTGTLLFRVQEGQIVERWGDADMVGFLSPLGFELVPPNGNEG